MPSKKNLRQEFWQLFITNFRNLIHNSLKKKKIYLYKKKKKKKNWKQSALKHYFSKRLKFNQLNNGKIS